MEAFGRMPSFIYIGRTRLRNPFSFNPALFSRTEKSKGKAVRLILGHDTKNSPLVDWILNSDSLRSSGLRRAPIPLCEPAHPGEAGIIHGLGLDGGAGIEDKIGLRNNALPQQLEAKAKDAGWLIAVIAGSYKTGTGRYVVLKELGCFGRDRMRESKHARCQFRRQHCTAKNHLKFLRRQISALAKR